ncbi:MAG: hypothetical protein Q6373_024950 [Candidatus Sigynarchaeota archaeon]
MKTAAIANDVTVEEIVELVPSLARFVKGSSFILPRKNDSCYIVKGLSVFFLKRRCLDCLHFRQAKGCGIGSDCKSICLIPEESSTRGWTNIDDVSITGTHLLVLAKIFTLVQEELPSFIESQIPGDFFVTNCKKFIRIQPIVYRMLLDLDKQEEEIEAKFKEGKLPVEHKEKFMAEILAEKAELLDRLSLVI